MITSLNFNAFGQNSVAPVPPSGASVFLQNIVGQTYKDNPPTLLCANGDTIAYNTSQFGATNDGSASSNKPTLQSAGGQYGATSTTALVLSTPYDSLIGDFTIYASALYSTGNLYLIGCNDSASVSAGSFFGVFSGVFYVALGNGGTFVSRSPPATGSSYLFRIRRESAHIKVAWTGLSEVDLGIPTNGGAQTDYAINLIGAQISTANNLGSSNTANRILGVAIYDSLLSSGDMSKFETWASANGWGSL